MARPPFPPPGRLVYSTERTATCPKCGWPEKDCRCAAAGAEEAVPDKIVAKLRIEKSGRGGKTVTVIDGLPRNREFLKNLAGELKRACGTGGAVGETTVEIQGDRREDLRDLLARRGWTVKG
jgi:translation initiation factor 1